MSTAGALPVKRILLEALVLPVNHVAVIGLFFLPLLATELALFLLSVLGDIFLPDSPTIFIEFIAARLLGHLLLVLVFVVLATLAAVACHRVFLLGPESMANHELVWWSSRETRFIGWELRIAVKAVLIMIVIAVLFFPVLSLMVAGGAEENPIILYALGFLIGLLAAYVVGRSSLVLPATAVDERPSMGWAWSISEGNGLRLMFLLGLLPVLSGIVFELLPTYDSFVYKGFVLVASFYLVAAEIAILSLSYRELVSDHPAEPAAPAARATGGVNLHGKNKEVNHR